MKRSFTCCVTIIFASVFIISSCKKKEDDIVIVPPVDNVFEDVPLTADEVAMLESVPDTFIRLEDIILENGEDVRTFLQANDPGFLLTYPSGRLGSTTSDSPLKQKLMYLARMYATGNNLVDDDNYTFPSEGPDKPAQYGLAYSWGSKDVLRHRPPVVRDPGCNDFAIHGLDCSGMIWVMINAAKLTPPPVPQNNFTVEKITDAAKWTAAFKGSADYKDLRMKNMGQIPPGEMKNGDMILWSKHVGIFLYGSFFQSSGDPNAPGCTNNLLPSRGPTCKALGAVINSGKLNAYKVFRVVHGNDYKLTLARDYSGTGTTSPFCMMGTYIDTTIFNITISLDGVVSLNEIKNSNPYVPYVTVGGGCACLGMSFSNGSVIEYTNFTGSIGLNDSLNLAYTMTSTWCSSTDSYQCAPDPPGTYPGLVIPGNEETGNLQLPADTIPVTYPWDQGTITIEYIR